MDKIAREYDYGHWVLEQHESKPRPLRVWNGIFAAGDRRAKRDLKTISLGRDRNSETTTREKWPQKRLFCWRAISCGFRKTGWWRMQPNETGLHRRNREFSVIFRPKQAFDVPMAADQSNFDRNPNQLHKR